MAAKMKKLIAILCMTAMIFQCVSITALSEDQEEAVAEILTDAAQPVKEAVPAEEPAEPEQSEAPAETAAEPEQPEAPAETAAEPEQPEAPAETAAEPEQPEAPAEEPAEPEQPEAPAETVAEPEQPEAPAETAAEPEQPEAPAEEPAEPEQPEAPAETVAEPEQPEVPAEEPAEPEQAEVPAEEPAEPEQPEVPTEEPAEPEQSEDPAEQEEPDTSAEVSAEEEPEVPAESSAEQDEQAVPENNEASGDDPEASDPVEETETDSEDVHEDIQPDKTQTGTGTIQCAVTGGKDYILRFIPESTERLSVALSGDCMFSMKLQEESGNTIQNMRSDENNEIFTACNAHKGQAMFLILIANGSGTITIRFTAAEKEESVEEPAEDAASVTEESGNTDGIPETREEAKETNADNSEGRQEDEPAAEDSDIEPEAEQETEVSGDQPEAEEDGESEPDDTATEEEIPDFEIDGDVLKKYNGEDETVTVPDGIRAIGTRAFAGNTKIKKVVLPDSVEIIKNYAFDGCSNLAGIHRGPASRLQTIGIGAFRNDTLLDVSFADSVELVVSNAFEMNVSGTEETPQEETEAAEEPAGAEGEETVETPEMPRPEDCSVQISISWDTDDPQIGDVAHLSSILTGYENLPYSLQWQISRDKETWTDYAGATEPQLDVIMTAELEGVYFRLAVNVDSTQESD